MNISRDQVQSYSRSNVAIYMQQVYLWMTCALGVTALSPKNLSINFQQKHSILIE